MKKIIISTIIIFFMGNSIFSNQEFKLTYNLFEIATHSAEYSNSTKYTERPSIENTDPNADKKYVDWTYIPIPQEAKEGIYWTVKSVTLAGFTANTLLMFIAPVIENQEHKDFIYDRIYGPWCHQWNIRTWQYSNGSYMPLCQRCTAMYLGVWLGHFDSFIWDAFQIADWEKWEQRLLHIGIYTLMLLPMYIDGKLQYEYPLEFESTPARRTITGLMFGYAATAIFDQLLQLILDY
ncbi:MAG: DUF2085 domain-containing protein [Spirochaetales bacterium]|nr:DUF2085 domain-containing protein [Spirochaetales bacterium]